MSRNLRYLFIAGIVALQAVTVAAIVVSSRVTNEDALRDHMAQILSQVADESAENTRAFLDHTDYAARLSDTLLERGVLPVDDIAALEEFFLGQLRSHPALGAMFFGRPDGSFVYVSRDDAEMPDGFRTKVIAVDGSDRSTDLVWRGPDLSVVAEAPDPDDDYDPRDRPWYRQASEMGDLIWTEPYVFFTSRAPGVTRAAPVVIDGEEVGVIGVDVQLLELSYFLGGLEISESGLAFIVDDGGDLVAYRDPGAIPAPVEGSTEEFRLAAAAEIDDAIVREAWLSLAAALPDEDGASRRFSVGSDRHSAVFLPLGETDWTVVVAAPENDFVGDLRGTNRTNTLIAVAVGLAAILLTIPIVAMVGGRFERLHTRSRTDDLTELPNRRAFEETLDQVFARARRRDKPLVAAVIDIDRFKPINDTFGHAVGDEALQLVAERLRNGLRESDVIGRLGGDEFVALLVDRTLEESAEIADRLRASISDSTIVTSEGPVPLTVSIGLAGLHDDVAGGDELVVAADWALLRAKREGRDCVRVAGRDAGAHDEEPSRV